MITQNSSTLSFAQRLAKEVDPISRINLIEEVLRPPEPQILDTCVLQNLDWIDRKLEAEGSVIWDDAAVADLERKYGVDLANDLIDLGILYKEFENRNGYPWLVCKAAVEEASFLCGYKGDRLRDMLQFLIGHQDDWSNDAYPGIAQGMLLASKAVRVSPLILQALGVKSAEEVHSATGPLALLPDLGDRMVAAHAMLSNIPVVLTTDRNTFWKHRESLDDMGLQVMRPGELLSLYLPYWEAIDVEFKRRCETNTAGEND